MSDNSDSGRQGISARRRARPALSGAALLCAVALTGVVTGCARSESGAAPPAPSGDAIAACLTAAAEMNSFPVDGPGATTATAEPDEQGWWAVHVSVETGAGTEYLTCTAVPDDAGGVRAASWSTMPPD